MALVMIPIRLKQEQLDQMDAIVARLGGTRSDFVRLAVDERIKALGGLVHALNGGATVIDVEASS